MNILLTGASGFVGSHILAALSAAGHQTTLLSRRQGGDFCKMQTCDDWLPQLNQIDAVINTVGIIAESGTQCFDSLHTQAPIALFQACAQAGVHRVIQLSALGADATAFSAYHLSKRAADDYLRQLELDWFVLRPSLIYGKGGKSAAAFMRLARLPMIPVIGRGQQRLQPVHISDLVATVLQCLSTSQTRQTLDIVGPQILTFAEWLQRMRIAQGRPQARLLHIPTAAAMVLCQLGRHCNALLQPDNLRMLERGSTADVQPLVRFLGRLPLAPESRLFFTENTTTRSAL